MKRKNDSSKSTSPSAPDASLITLADVPNVLLEIEGKLIELDEQGTASERKRLNEVITIIADLADQIAVIGEVAA